MLGFPNLAFLILSGLWPSLSETAQGRDRVQMEEGYSLPCPLLDKFEACVYNSCSLSPLVSFSDISRLFAVMCDTGQSS